jgi:hypothetical protein
MSKVDDLITRECIQLSRKYRTVGIIPKGESGLSALRKADESAWRRIMERAEGQAREEFLRLSSSRQHRIELTVDEFNEYLRKTGRKPDGQPPRTIKEES